jgi:hypothetical protein
VLDKVLQCYFLNFVFPFSPTFGKFVGELLAFVFLKAQPSWGDGANRLSLGHFNTGHILREEYLVSSFLEICKRSPLERAGREMWKV